MTDITSFIPQQREVELTNPITDEGLGMHFTLLPMSAPEVKQAEREYLNARLAKRKNQITAEAIEASKTKLIVAAVVDWRFDKDAEGKDATLDGAQPEFSKGALKSLIAKHDWIRNFLDRELADDAAFYQASLRA